MPGAASSHLIQCQTAFQAEHGSNPFHDITPSSLLGKLNPQMQDFLARQPQLKKEIEEQMSTALLAAGKSVKSKAEVAKLKAEMENNLKEMNKELEEHPEELQEINSIMSSQAPPMLLGPPPLPSSMRRAKATVSQRFKSWQYFL
eukprot:TRINITY_DN21027_c0_g1_i1.p1 TRINITY_DN21027_c0_g1~~TRINITY_DN21027_c0_g1_i1.p1  ORF type:complete len:145 (+),score=39.53 TRINITY_DN21027_c0_g1_i1:98-532(+)